MFPSYRNQSADLQSKSTDWFLYDGNIGRQGVKTLSQSLSNIPAWAVYNSLIGNKRAQTLVTILSVISGNLLFRSSRL